MSVQKYRKKPVVIEAVEWDGTTETSDAIRAWAEPDIAVVDTDHIQHLWDYDAGCYIMPRGQMIHAPFHTRCQILLTMEFTHIVLPSDWIIKGEQGEFYPCKPDIFAKTYEPTK